MLFQCPVANFDHIAGLYDRLAWLIFGHSLIRAQQYFLSEIPHDAAILVIGGGTGSFLKDYVPGKHYQKILFLESSSTMIARARKNLGNHDKIEYRHGHENTIKAHESFDALLTPFFLDIFMPETQKNICDKLWPHLKQGGIWLYSDFLDSNRFYQQLLLGLMNRFFRLTAGIEADRFYDPLLVLNQYPLRLLRQQYFYQNMVFTGIYEKALPACNNYS